MRSVTTLSSVTFSAGVSADLGTHMDPVVSGSLSQTTGGLFIRRSLVQAVCAWVGPSDNIGK